ncbi:uncharacterized protein LOC131940322 [Physella acuta]|uniref:uncharacterized protein LOC131940322 n=1 Tax=Physella acuta TaxID=109671 RepID=UPI0027DD8572|nr:uncharacterized protein LOC131940322 [Physella acuta]
MLKMFGSPGLDDLEYARKLQEEYDREIAVKIADDDNSESRSVNDNPEYAIKFNGSGRSKNAASIQMNDFTEKFHLGLSPVDPSLEFSDPNPNIFELFLQFNIQFFWGRLSGIEVKWSPRMTLCAGLCVYEGRGGLCSVRLSLPLLKLRPRKDLVETLLHEMIHAYLFITDNDRDHDGHGPQFKSHMHRINKETGANISIYHTFHDEVEAYQQHWWRCDGPCQSRKPYFGYVKRAMNRAPSPRDFWWGEHQASCGGSFTKIKEPEGYGQKKGKGKEDKIKNPTTDIRAFVGRGISLGTSSQKNVIQRNSTFSSNNSSKSISTGNKAKQSVIVNGVLTTKAVGPSPLFSSLPNSSAAKSVAPSSFSIPSVKNSSNPHSLAKVSSNTAVGVSLEKPPSKDKPKMFDCSAISLESLDNFPENEDDSWMLDADTGSSEGYFTSPSLDTVSPLNKADIIDLTAKDIKNCESLNMSHQTPKPQHKKKILPTVGMNSSKRISQKYPGTSNIRKKRTPVVHRGNKNNSGGRRPDNSKVIFSRHFVSVCEGGKFTEKPKALKKPKSYVFDELDDNDDLWVETSSLQKVQAKHSACNKQEGFTEVTDLESDEEGSSTDINEVTHKKDGDVKTELSTSFAKNTQDERKIEKPQKSNYVSQVGSEDVALSKCPSEKFTGQGYRLGTGEAGSSFLSQIRKSFNSNTSGTRNTLLGPIQRPKTGESVLQASNSSFPRKRSSEVAFGLESLQGQNNSKYINNRDSQYLSTSSSTHGKGQDNLATRHTDGNPATRHTDGNPATRQADGNPATRQAQDTPLVSCPVCTIKVPAQQINDHLDTCLL